MNSEITKSKYHFQCPGPKAYTGAAFGISGILYMLIQSTMACQSLREDNYLRRAINDTIYRFTRLIKND